MKNLPTTANNWAEDVTKHGVKPTNSATTNSRNLKKLINKLPTPTTAILEVSMEFKSVIEMLTSTDYVNEATAHNLISNLLLSSEINGRILENERWLDTWGKVLAVLKEDHPKTTITQECTQNNILITKKRLEELKTPTTTAHSNRGDKVWDGDTPSTPKTKEEIEFDDNYLGEDRGGADFSDD